MATYFVVSDVHSYFDEMIHALSEAGYDPANKNHVFVSCGDLFDRGPKSLDLLRWVNNIPKSNKILILGNHEELMIDAICRRRFESHDYHNGTNLTAEQITGLNPYDHSDYEILTALRDNEEWNKYIDSCIDYYETDKYIFVHGWIPCFRDDPISYHSRGVHYMIDENWRNGDWPAARWYCCYDAWHQGVIVPDKTIVAGHWHTSYGHNRYHQDGTEWDDVYCLVADPPIHTAKSIPFRDKGIIGIDACTAITHRVNVLKLGKQKKVI